MRAKVAKALRLEIEDFKGKNHLMLDQVVVGIFRKKTCDILRNDATRELKEKKRKWMKRD